MAFDFTKLLTDPQFAYGMSLLGSRGAKNPYADAQAAAMQIQQLQQAQAERKAKLEAQQRLQAFDLTKYKTPAQAAQGPQEIGRGAFAEPRMTEGTPGTPESMDWLQAASDYIRAGGDPSDIARLQGEMEKVQSPFMAIGGSGVLDKRTGKFMQDPQVQQNTLERIREQASLRQELEQVKAGLRPAPTIPEQIIQTPEGVFAKPRGGTLEQLLAPSGQPLSKPLSSAAMKPLPKNIINQLQEDRNIEMNLDNAMASFKPKYGSKGVFGIGADAQLEASARLGMDQDAVAWWKNLRKNVDMVERKATFGATLTGNELQAWKAATLSPSDDPATIQRNLGIRAALAKKVLQMDAEDYAEALPQHAETVRKIAGRGKAPAPKAAPQLPAGWSFNP